jgi:hypothetical protein
MTSTMITMMTIVPIPIYMVSFSFAAREQASDTGGRPGDELS